MASSIKRVLLWRPSSHPRYFSQKMPLLFNSTEQELIKKEPELDQELIKKKEPELESEGHIVAGAHVRRFSSGGSNSIYLDYLLWWQRRFSSGGSNSIYPDYLLGLQRRFSSGGSNSIYPEYLLGWQFVCYNCPPEKRVNNFFDTIQAIKRHGRDHEGCLKECEFCFSRFTPNRFYQHQKSRECLYDRVAYLKSLGLENVYKGILKFRRQGADVGICVCCGQSEFRYENYRCEKCGYSLPPPTRRK